MRKIISVLCCCTLCCYCFSQTGTGNDPNKIATDTTHRSTSASSKIIQPELIIYPNPAKNKITVQVKHFNPGMVSVKTLDTKGKLVREDSRLLTNGTEDIVMFLMLKAGIYFIIISEPGKIARKKLVVF